MSHSFRATDENGDTYFSFNSDLSGGVTIIHRGDEIVVPGEHLLQFVANHIRQERIAELEQGDDRQVLGLISKSV